MERKEKTIILGGEALQDPNQALAIKRILRSNGLATKEVVEHVIYTGFQELKQFEKEKGYHPGLAEGAFEALTNCRDVRIIEDEEQTLFAYNDLAYLIEEGRLEDIEGIGKGRASFLEKFQLFIDGSKRF